MMDIKSSIKKLKELPYLDRPYSSRGWGHKLHSLCSYQSKLKPGIAYHLAKLFGEKEDLIFEPFAGVGTIPFELAQRGIKTVSLDINPIAYTVSLAKLKKQDKKKILKQAIVDVKEIKKIIEEVGKGKIAKIYWCESGKCYDKIMKLKEGLDLFGSDLKKAKLGKCIACNKKTTNKAYVASSY